VREFLNNLAETLTSTWVKEIKGGRDKPNERHNIQGRRVVRIAQEVHEGVYNTSCDFGEFDSSDMDRLDEELSVFRRLKDIVRTASFQVFLSHFFKLSLLSFLKLLLEE
jgi:hypothetical protein